VSDCIHPRPRRGPSLPMSPPLRCPSTHPPATAVPSNGSYTWPLAAQSVQFISSCPSSTAFNGSQLRSRQVQKCQQRRAGRRRQSLQRASQRCNSRITHLTPDDNIEAPRIYRRVEIEGSAFGVKGFDLGHTIRQLLSPRSAFLL
jgi:hypothetical protein